MMRKQGLPVNEGKYTMFHAEIAEQPKMAQRKSDGAGVVRVKIAGRGFAATCEFAPESEITLPDIPPEGTSVICYGEGGNRAMDSGNFWVTNCFPLAGFGPPSEKSSSRREAAAAS